MEEGSEAQGPINEVAYEAHGAGFRAADQETLADRPD